ncbi:MAG TPA: hypothetical protein VFF19_13630 [Reyranella sp.]|jgi:hypothetical protein|nr:hypothetical protein [Reyranella sp.]
MTDAGNGGVTCRSAAVVIELGKAGSVASGDRGKAVGPWLDEYGGHRSDD